MACGGHDTDDMNSTRRRGHPRQAAGLHRDPGLLDGRLQDSEAGRTVPAVESGLSVPTMNLQPLSQREGDPASSLLSPQSSSHCMLIADARMAAQYLERAVGWATDVDQEIVADIMLAHQRLLEKINSLRSQRPTISEPAPRAAAVAAVGDRERHGAAAAVGGLS